jgi:hypothetical protein
MWILVRVRVKIEDCIVESIKYRAKEFVLNLVGDWKAEQGGYMYQLAEMGLGKLNLWLIM